ncbi:MAG: LysM peptidoglycan-binding domain-containing protein [Brevinema sp.]
MKKITALIVLFVACGQQNIQHTEAAVQAMERARVAEAPIYAYQEYSIAENLFNQMNRALETNNIDLANQVAISVVEAANKATDTARRNKAAILIERLKQALAVAQKTGVDKEYPTEYAQASQHLLDAENAYQKNDYQQAISSAQQGLDILAGLYNGSLYTVIKGDTLWYISDKFYRNPLLWRNIWEANKTIIKDPHWIYPKQQLTIPNALEQ